MLWAGNPLKPNHISRKLVILIIIQAKWRGYINLCMPLGGSGEKLTKIFQVTTGGQDTMLWTPIHPLNDHVPFVCK